MSVEVLDESGTDADVDELVRLARFVLDRMRLHPRTEMCLLLVDEDTSARLNAQWRDGHGPTDVLAFPIDELTPGSVHHAADAEDDDLPDAYLGDLALCPAVATRQAGEQGHSAAAETNLLVVHGILHLVGYDHAEPAQHREMFDLQARLLADWQGVRDADKQGVRDADKQGVRDADKQGVRDAAGQGVRDAGPPADGVVDGGTIQ